MSAFYPFRGGGRPKQTMSAFLTVFFNGELPYHAFFYYRPVLGMGLPGFWKHLFTAITPFNIKGLFEVIYQDIKTMQGGHWHSRSATNILSNKEVEQ